MSDTKANVDSYIERLEKPAGVPPFIQREVAAIMRHQRAEIERLTESLEIEQNAYDLLAKDHAKLQAVVDAAEDDMECAKANCGQYPEAKKFSSKDCSAFTERGLRCSDCPVDVWLASTSEALAALEEADDE